MLCIACGGPLGPPQQLGAASLAACGRCGSRTALPRLSLAEMSALHDSAGYFEKEYFEARRGQELVTERRFTRLLELLARTCPDLKLTGRRLLDVGCDTGEFALAGARLAGLVPYGVDVARLPLEHAGAADVEVAQGDLSQAPAAFCDFALVTAIDVVEHVPDPAALLAEIRTRLAPGGLVYLETPNWASFVYSAGRAAARALGGRPHAPFERLFPPEHVQYFSSAGLRAVAVRAGFRPLTLFTQPLRREALAGGAVLGAAMWLLQAPDRLLAREILLSALLAPSEDQE